MAMEYEYAFVADVMELKPGLREATSEELGKNLTVALAQSGQKFATTTRTLEGGGWETISHSLTSIDKHLVLTVHMRRPWK